jgi:hypothetical protein
MIRISLNFTKSENVCYGVSSLYMIANTDMQAESEEWHTCRWFRITASTAKQANNLGNILNLHGDSADMQKFQPFLRNSIWGLNQYRSKYMQYGIENEDQARSDYLKFMRSSVPETIVSDSSGCSECPFHQHIETLTDFNDIDILYKTIMTPVRVIIVSDSSGCSECPCHQNIDTLTDFKDIDILNKTIMTPVRVIIVSDSSGCSECPFHHNIDTFTDFNC